MSHTYVLNRGGLGVIGQGVSLASAAGQYVRRLRRDGPYLARVVLRGAQARLADFAAISHVMLQGLAR